MHVYDYDKTPTIMEAPEHLLVLSRVSKSAESLHVTATKSSQV